MVRDYSSLVDRKKRLENKRDDLGRQRDAEVNSIDNKYEYKIEKVMREIEFIELLMTAHKKFVGEN